MVGAAESGVQSGTPETLFVWPLSARHQIRLKSCRQVGLSWDRFDFRQVITAF
jgi:hypothetical protein